MVPIDTTQKQNNLNVLQIFSETLHLVDVLLFGKSYDGESYGLSSQPLSLQTTVLHTGMRTSELINGDSPVWPLDCCMVKTKTRL